MSGFAYKLNDGQYPVENVPLPESDVLGQEASDSFFGLEREGGALLAYELAGTPLAATRGPGQDEYVDPHTLNQLYGNLGLSFDQPMRRAQADILVQQRKDYLARSYTLAHAPGGNWNTTANFATRLAVGALDPGNVAAAFMPVVGEARAALWAERAGPTLSRLAVGGIEGAAGMAALQPVQAAHDLAFQQSYGPMNAFMNVAFGGVLGGGLHASLGRFGDWLGGLHPETREAALRSSVAQMAEGRPVDATAAIASDPAFDTTSAQAPPSRVPEAAAPGVAAPSEPALPDELVLGPENEIPSNLAPRTSQPRGPLDIPFQEDHPLYQQALQDVTRARSAAPTDETFTGAIRRMGGIRTRKGDGTLTSEGGDVMSIIGDNPGHVMNLVNNRRGGMAVQKGNAVDNLTTAMKNERWLHPDADTNDFMDMLSRSAGGEKIYHPESEVQAEIAGRDLLDEEMSEAGITSADSREDAAQKLANFREAGGMEFAMREHADLASQEDRLLGEYGHEDWIGSDEWVRREEAGEDQFGPSRSEQEAAAGDAEAGADGRPETAGPGAGTSVASEAGSAEPLPFEPQSRLNFDDALDRARRSANDFLENREASTLAPPGAGEQAEREVASGRGDSIDEELAEAERTLADYQRNGVVSDEEAAALKEEAATDREAAQTQGEAAKAAATCLFLHP